MPDYQKGRVYRIDGGGLTYVGSTCETLCRRLTTHRDQIKHGQNISSKEVLSYPDAVITLVELYPCGSKEELIMRERYWYDIIPCVNKHRPFQSKEERSEYDIARGKAYRITHKEQVKLYNKKYKDAHREEINQKAREARQQKKLDKIN